MGHKVDVISGPPYPNLDSRINLIKLPGLNLFETFSFKDRLYKFFKKKNKTLNDWYEFISVLFGGFPELKTFGDRANNFLIENMNLNHNIRVVAIKELLIIQSLRT